MKKFNTAGTCRPNEHYMVDMPLLLQKFSEHFNLQTGYLLSFCFNKDKQPGLLPPVQLNDRTLIDAIV